MPFLSATALRASALMRRSLRSHASLRSASSYPHASFHYRMRVRSGRQARVIPHGYSTEQCCTCNNVRRAYSGRYGPNELAGNGGATKRQHSAIEWRKWLIGKDCSSLFQNVRFCSLHGTTQVVDLQSLFRLFLLIILFMIIIFVVVFGDFRAAEKFSPETNNFYRRKIWNFGTICG